MIVGWNYDPERSVVVPKDVVQWRVVASAESVVKIHVARGDGRFEIRELDERGDVYVLGDLIYEEREGGDRVCVFIDREW